MLKVTNTSNKVIGFRGEDGKPIAVLPETTVEVSDVLKTEVNILGEIGLARIEKTEEPVVESAEAEEPAVEKKTRRRAAKAADATI